MYLVIQRPKARPLDLPASRLLVLTCTAIFALSFAGGVAMAMLWAVLFG